MLVGGPVGSLGSCSCLRGLPGIQLLLLPAEQNASCTDKSPFLPLPLCLCVAKSLFITATVRVCCVHTPSVSSTMLMQKVMTIQQSDSTLTHLHS